MNRYTVPDPTCKHARKGVVTNQPDEYDQERPHASTAVCDREECIEDAKAWVWAITREAATHLRDSDRTPRDSSNSKAPS